MVYKTGNDFLTWASKYGKLIKSIKLKHVTLNLKALSNLLFCFNSTLVSFTVSQWDTLHTYIHTYIVYLITQVAEYARLES